MVQKIEIPKEFSELFGEMINKYLNHVDEYGDSWRRCHRNYLKRRLEETINKYNETQDISYLIDLANFCLFIWVRERKK